MYVVFCMGQPNKDAAEIYEKLQNCLNKEGNKVVNLTSLIKELIKKYLPELTATDVTLTMQGQVLGIIIDTYAGVIIIGLCNVWKQL